MFWQLLLLAVFDKRIQYRVTKYMESFEVG